MPDPAAKDPQPIGQSWLRRELCLPVPPAGSESFVLAGARRTEIRGSNAVEFYPRQYATDNTIVGHLRFALRHEPLDLGIVAGTMKAVDPAILQQWLRREPDTEITAMEAAVQRAIAAEADHEAEHEL